MRSRRGLSLGSPPRASCWGSHRRVSRWSVHGPRGASERRARHRVASAFSEHPRSGHVWEQSTGGPVRPRPAPREGRGRSGHGVGAAGRPAAAASRALCRLRTERRRAAAGSPQRTRWLRGYVPHLEFDAEWLISATHLKRQRMMLPVARETRETL